jgi:undecaprenyl diphosphate synthase
MTEPHPAAPGQAALPRHVAIVMDGNGRWAKRRFMPRAYGHKAGMDTVLKVVDACAERGIEFLTVYAFSSENWNRPEEEVSGLMGLVIFGVSKYLQRLAEQGVRIRIVGERSRLSTELREAWAKAERETEHNHRITLTVAFNYGGRWDVLQACQALVREGVDEVDITEEALSKRLAMNYAPDPDLLIRTSGECRISNFLIWQIAYSELYFTDCLWPDFDAAELDRALVSYAGRERRFGGVSAPRLAAEAQLAEPGG